MASINKVIVVGNLGADPETRFLPSGEAVTNIRVATTDKWKDKASGEMKEATEWHRISFFGRLAEVAGEYLKKGSQVYVEGSLRTRKWQDKESGQDRYSTEIRAEISYDDDFVHRCHLGTLLSSESLSSQRRARNLVDRRHGAHS